MDEGEGDLDDFKDCKWPFGGNGKPEDVAIPSGAGCAQINDVLARADEKAGEFSFGGQAHVLPSTAGLFVDGVGSIPVPITAEQAEMLITQCEKSPFGHDFDTKMDENVRKSWQLEPDMVQLKNPLWKTGLDELTKTIALRLGYENIPLESTLYKLLMYGEGGHFVKHQDTEKKDGMIATLVVQLPSLHEGGDLVVHSKGKVRYRHDFGKSDGTAAYLPHYAVHYADSEHAVEKVTKGYRLVLVYSICLPKTMRHFKRDPDDGLIEELAEAIANIDPEDDDSFALLLGHNYTEKSIMDLGFGAFKGIDRARVGVLEGANAVVPTDKQLKLLIGKLSHDIFYETEYTNSRVFAHMNSITWYSMAGEALGSTRNLLSTLNFLNPSQEMLVELWMPHGICKRGGYTGNEGPTKSTVYCTYAIIAWPAALHTEKTLEYMPEDVGVELLSAQKSTDAAVLRDFLENLNARLEGQGKVAWYSYRDDVSVKFCRTLCELLVAAGDSELVNFFFSKLCPSLDGLEDNESLIQPMISIVRAFDWNDIGQVILKTFGEFVSRRGEILGASNLEMNLKVVTGLDNGAAKQALLKLAAEKAACFPKDGLCLDGPVELLLEHAIRCEDKTIFDSVVNVFKEVDASLLEYVATTISQSIRDMDPTNERYPVLASIVSKRIEWLKSQIEVLDKPFTWEMSDAEFSDNVKVQAFLRGPAVSMKMTKSVHKFKGFQDARNCAADWMRNNQRNASFEMQASSTSGNAIVTITKTRKWYTGCQRNCTGTRRS
ncbi:hypothetical protein PF011_g126 [Phytophthora fragariae]|uniref:Fe2OG dioxygenase domain-containing protein n=1 Tax=Phytophthora fragariae TaxID=53985 RepID=A0A6A3MFY8_9STRA|nr:hypothetical protein PF011_g126 [Phytophthora fragariae]